MSDNTKRVAIAQVSGLHESGGDINVSVEYPKKRSEIDIIREIRSIGFRAIDPEAGMILWISPSDIKTIRFERK